MGEYAEMMLDGTCCEGCGEFIGDSIGYPRYCSAQCAGDRGVTMPTRKAKVFQPRQNPKTIKCTQCNRLFRKEAAMQQHRRDAHQPASRPIGRD